MPSSPSQPHPPLPTDLQTFKSYILSSSPPNRTPFPDPNDFTTAELESLLHFALATYQTAREKLQELLDERRERQICEVLIQAQETLLALPTHPLAPYTHAFYDVALSAKFADDFRFRNLIVGLKSLILRLQGEREKVEGRFPRGGGDGELSGDEDDWFLAGGGQKAEREQRELCEAIEEHLKTGKEEEAGGGKVEVKVMMG
ncbi:Hypothetical predicted protein [Lecanosticta acicola]|uniref:Uncharacterized protein n=1 Tax=Lecanosticta acicola TaxID=111012 RepID=A0AAI8Z5W2_9PEZI|nr:Hypothetical predicted protein [Lecanosticta acicola]